MLLSFLPGNYEKIQDVGLLIQYKNNTTSQLVICMQNSSSCLCSHLFCPSCMARNKSRYSRVTKNWWIRYVFWNHVDSWNIPSADWNLHKTDGPRTNDHLECWHNRLWQVVGKSHPNIFECVDIFQRERVSTEVLIQQLEAGACWPRRRKMNTLRNSQKDLAVIISLSDYVASMSQYINFWIL